MNLSLLSILLVLGLTAVAALRETLGKKCRCWLLFLKTMIVDEHHNRCGW